MTVHEFGGEPEATRRNTWAAARRGLRGACPSCGAAGLFRRYLKVRDACTKCGTDLTPFRADDGPAYMTIFTVGHIVVPLMVLLERMSSPPTWVHVALWTPLLIGLSLAFLPLFKGAMVGIQWAHDIKSDERR